MDEFIEIGGGETWNGKDSNLKVGDSITGEYLTIQTDVGPNNAKMYTVRTDAGDLGIWGSTVLDGRFEQVKLGSIVRVTYMGESDKPGKFGKPFKLWKVESKPNNVPAAGTATAADQPPAGDPGEQLSLDDLPY